MRLKIDENLPTDIVAPLSSLGHDVNTVFGERLTGISDEELLPIVHAEGRVLVTQDVRLADVRRVRTGEAHGFVLVRVEELDRAAIVDVILSAFRSNDTASWTHSMVVISSARVRVTPVTRKDDR